jgi:hypothetical protein
MERKPILGWGATVVLCTLSLVIMAVSAPVGAQGGWQSPLLIPAAEFENNGVDPLEDNFYDVDGYFSGTGDQELIMVAVVRLPNFATITRFEAAMVDIGDCPTVPDPIVELRSADYGSGAPILHASVIANDNPNMEIFADTSIQDGYVNNLSRAYFVVVKMCGVFQGFQGVRVHYTE